MADVSYNPKLDVDPVTRDLIFHSAHFLGMDPREFLDEAVRTYLEQRREEVRHGMVESMRLLDGALGSSVTMVAGQASAQVEDATSRSGRALTGVAPEPTEAAPDPVTETAPQMPPAPAPVQQPDYSMAQPEQAVQPEAPAVQPEFGMQPDGTMTPPDLAVPEHSLPNPQVMYTDHNGQDVQFRQG